MKTSHIVIAVILLAIILIVVGTYNSLNSKYQAVNSAKSKYSSAINVCSEKIKGVWQMADQYMKHEAATFKAVTEARSGWDKSLEKYKKSLQGSDSKELTKAGAGVVQAALAFRIQIEAYPQLQAIQTSKENMRNLEESTNEIKTALDDWITVIQSYNTFRGSFLPSILSGLFGRFPSEIQYYEGEKTKLNVDELNPQNK